MSDLPNENAAPAKKKGWPKGKPRVKKDAASPPRPELRQEQKPKLEDRWAGGYPTEYVSDDRLHIPRDQIPDGMDYQWVTVSIYGQPQPLRRAQFERMGWFAVPSKRHPNFMGKDYDGEINVDGLVLMERPLSWSLKARAMDRKKAEDQVRIREMASRGGDLPGVTLDTQHPSVINKANKVNHSYEGIPVPSPSYKYSEE